MKTSQSTFDQYQGHDVTAFHLENDNGVIVTVLSQGGIIREMLLPTKDGQKQNILLAYPATKDYYANPFYVNMMIGTAGGRIKQGQFTIDGNTTHVTPNEGQNTLHGGPNGFHSVNWDGKLASTSEGATLTLTHRFDATEPGDFPAMTVTTTYTLGNDNRLQVKFTAESDAPTIFNPTYHVYFNVSGEKDIKHQILKLNSPHHMDVDTEKIPTGKLLDNTNTPFDFTQSAVLGDAIAGMQDTTEKGFDDIFEVVPGADNEIATLTDPASKRSVTLQSKRNGLVVFTANSFTPDMNLTLGQGAPYMGVALEAQNLSDATRFENLGDTTLRPGETKSYEIDYQFKF